MSVEKDYFLETINKSTDPLHVFRLSITNKRILGEKPSIGFSRVKYIVPARKKAREDQSSTFLHLLESRGK